MKYIAIVILTCLVLTSSFAQQNQQTLTAEFDSYSKHVLQEKIFMHTDRSSYLTGETLWFKIYCRDASYFNPLQISKVAYVEILDSNNKPVLQTKIALAKKGNGNGSLYIPVSMNSGHYIVRAYTQWMKNFSSDLFFQQALTIINPFSKLGLKPESQNNKYDLQFLPEGGHLVNHIPSTVGFRMVDQQGKGTNFRGAIVDELNDTIVTFKPLHFGLGTFTFTPSKEHTYRAVVRDTHNTTMLVPLPDIADFGCVIQLHGVLSDKLTLTVSMTSELPLQNPTVYCAVQSQQKLVLCEAKFLVNGNCEFPIDKNKLSSGISHITVFDSELNPVCERLYFKEPITNLDLILSLNQMHFSSRKKVEVNIQPMVNGTITETDMSIAVYKVDSMTDPNQQDIKSYLYLTSELKGNIESPGYYFQKSNSDRIEAIDNLLLTHGWSRYHWKDIRQYKTNTKTDFIPEVSGHIIQATLTNKLDSTLKDNISAYLSIPGKNSKLYLSRSNKGRLLFETQDLYGSHELILQTNTLVDSIYKIKLLTPFSSQVSNFLLPQFNLRETYKNQIEERSLDMQVNNIFYEQENEIYLTKNYDSIPFYGHADEKYQLDDYTRFPTMEEVMREYVPGVMVRKQKGKFHFLTVDNVGKSIFRNDPLVLLDGVPIFDIDQIMAFDPRKIKLLDVVSKRYYLGTSAFDGIVSYRTYKGNLGGFQPDAKSLIVNYEGMQLQHDFFSPKYETQQQRDSRTPDTRNLLFWSPNVTSSATGAHVEFYTSDVVGNYKVVIQGITNDGHASQTTTTFDVVDKLNY